MWKNAYWLIIGTCFLALSVVGCSESEPGDGCHGTGPTRCVGAYPPDRIIANADESVLTFSWIPEGSGPRCVHGDTFRAFLRKGTSNDLVIYLPNDGAWLPKSQPILLENGVAPNSLRSATQTNFTEDDADTHPFLKNADFLYIPPCDGSLYIGDLDYSTQELESDAAYGNDTEPRYYRGFINTTASVTAAANYQPNPKRVFLFGSGAGSYGVLGLAIDVATTFPDSQIYVLQDGSPGLGMGTIDKNFVFNLMEAWGGQDVKPTDCHDCLSNGHITNIINWDIDHYPNLHFATYVSSQEDSTRTFINIKRGGGTISKEIWQCMVSRTFGRLKAKDEKREDNRFNYFIVDGSHDTVNTLDDGEQYVIKPLDNPDAGISFYDWLEQFVNNDPEFTSYSEIPIDLDESIQTCVGAGQDDN